MNKTNDNMKPITNQLLAMAGVTRPTFIRWLELYTVNNEPLGVKVGGRWRVNVKLLKEFLSHGGEKHEVV